jgi:hypothetical protein
MEKEDREELNNIETKLNKLSAKYGCCFDMEANKISYIDRSNERWVHKIRAYIPEKEL